MKIVILEKIFIDNTHKNKKLDQEVFKNIEYSHQNFYSHRDIAKELITKKPYTITVIIDNLKSEFWNKKEYVKYTKIPINTKYRELLYQYFFKEFGDEEGQIVYRKYLDKYKPLWLKEGKKQDLDDYIIKFELEHRYKKTILQKYRNLKKLKKPRFQIERERYYNLQHPLNYVDHRNPYDNIFIWKESNQRFVRRGESGSSQQREINSKFIYGYSLINQKIRIPSYLFLYSGENELIFIKKFNSLTIPDYDIGSNYDIDEKVKEKILTTTNFIKWDSFDKVKEITIYKYC